jgi:hypothetical protein
MSNLSEDWCLLKATQESLREHMLEIHRLRAERDALRADAERYRWLRDIDTGPAQIRELISDDAQPYMTLKSGNILDAAIDAAREKK